MQTLREYADKLGECYLNWSRAKEQGDKTAMEAALDEGEAAAMQAHKDGLDLEALLNMHKADKDKLCLKRGLERYLGNGASSQLMN